MTKYNAQLVTPAIIPEVVRKAFKVAQTEKFGATHIDFPEDIAKAEVDGQPLTIQQPRDPQPLTSRIDAAAELVNKARFPIVLCGNGVVRGRASAALREFVDKTNMPCAHTFMAKGVLPCSDPRSLLTVGLQARDWVSCGFDRADVVLAVGYDLVEYPPARWNPARDKHIIHIDCLPAEVDSHYQLACGIEAGIATSLRELADKITPRDQQDMVSTLRQTIFQELAEMREDRGFPLKPQKILCDVRRAMGTQDILISDVGAHKLWIARMYPCDEPNTCLISNGFASMGIALPGSIGAKLLYPERRVLSISGDGGFLMNVQELETAVRCNAPVVAMVWTDGGYGLIEWKQMNEYGRASHVDFGNPEFVGLAKSFGCEAFRIRAAEELAPALEQAFQSNRPVVIDCPVDYGENLKLTDKLGKLVCPI